MKKTVSALLLLLLCVSALFGCGEKENIPFEYSCKVLIHTETPDPSLVLAGDVQTPVKGVSVLSTAFPADRFFAIVSQGNIQEIEPHHSDDYMKKDSMKELHEILNMSRKELGEAFPTTRDCFVWEDAVLFHFYVPESDTAEGNKSEYAGKYIFIEYREKEDEVYFESLSAEEFKDFNHLHSIHSAHKGRIGDKFYLANGYYDLSEHQYKLYESENELPPFSVMVLLNNDMEILELLKQDDRLKEEITDGMYVDGMYLIKDRIHLTVTADNRYYGSVNGEDSYEGSKLIRVMLEADTFEILYAEAFYSEKYNIGASMALYCIGDDGLLYDPYYEE